MRPVQHHRCTGRFLFHMTDTDFWKIIRQALLTAVDAIERKCGIEPRTAVIRKRYKQDA